MSWASFLPFSAYALLDLGSGRDRQTDGQTDRQTDSGHCCIMSASYGGGGIISQEKVTVSDRHT